MGVCCFFFLAAFLLFGPEGMTGCWSEISIVKGLVFVLNLEEIWKVKRERYVESKTNFENETTMEGGCYNAPFSLQGVVILN